MLKLSELDGVAVGRFELTHCFSPKHPVSGKTFDFSVEIRSTQSDKMRVFYNARLHQLQKDDLEEKRTGRAKLIDLNELEAAEVEECLRLLVSVNGLIGDDGKEIEQEQYRDVLRQFKWLRSQIREAAAEEGNFLLE